MPKRNYPEEPREIVTSLRLSQEEHEALRRVATRNHRSISGQLRHLIAQIAAEDALREEAA